MASKKKVDIKKKEISDLTKGMSIFREETDKTSESVENLNVNLDNLLISNRKLTQTNKNPYQLPFILENSDFTKLKANNKKQEEQTNKQNNDLESNWKGANYSTDGYQIFIPQSPSDEDLSVLNAKNKKPKRKSKKKVKNSPQPLENNKISTQEFKSEPQSTEELYSENKKEFQGKPQIVDLFKNLNIETEEDYLKLQVLIKEINSDSHNTYLFTEEQKKELLKELGRLLNQVKENIPTKQDILTESDEDMIFTILQMLKEFVDKMKLGREKLHSSSELPLVFKDLIEVIIAFLPNIISYIYTIYQTFNEFLDVFSEQLDKTIETREFTWDTLKPDKYLDIIMIKGSETLDTMKNQGVRGKLNALINLKNSFSQAYVNMVKAFDSILLMLTEQMINKPIELLLPKNSNSNGYLESDKRIEKIGKEFHEDSKKLNKESLEKRDETYKKIWIETEIINDDNINIPLNRKNEDNNSKPLSSNKNASPAKINYLASLNSGGGVSNSSNTVSNTSRAPQAFKPYQGGIGLSYLVSQGSHTTAKTDETNSEKSKQAHNELTSATQENANKRVEIAKEETKAVKEEKDQQVKDIEKTAEAQKSASDTTKELITSTLESFKGVNPISDGIINFTSKNISKIFDLFKKSNKDKVEDTKETEKEINKTITASAEKTATTEEELTKAIKENSEERNEATKGETQTLEEQTQQRISILGQLAKAYTDNSAGVKDAIGTILGTLKGDNTIANGLLDSVEKALPKLVDIFSKTNEKINKDVKDSTSERAGVIKDGAEAAVEITDGALGKIEENVGLVVEGISMVFEAMNESLKEKLEQAEEEYEAISEKHEEVADKVEESNNRIKSLHEEAKSAQGGRLMVIQEQISREMDANQELASQEKQLAKDKEKAQEEKEKLEKKIKKNEIKMQVVQAVGNIALGITKAWSMGPIAGGIMAAIVAAAGAVQIAQLNKQMSKLADGGLLNGKTHAQGGMRVEGTNIEVEGGEYVINRASTRKNLGLVSYINSQRRELTPNDINGYFNSSGAYAESPNFKTMFAQGGQLPSENVINTYENNVMLEAIESINFQPVVSVVDIANVQQNLTRVTEWTDTSSF